MFLKPSINSCSRKIAHLSVLFLCFLTQSCSLLLGSRSDAACILNYSDRIVTINSSPAFRSPTGYWEKFMQCPIKDSINENGNRVFFQNFGIYGTNCSIIYAKDFVATSIIRHDFNADTGSYQIHAVSVFYLGESQPTVWPKKRIPLKPTDIKYNKLSIRISASDTILLQSKKEIFDFVQKRKLIEKQKIIKPIHRKYNTIVQLQ